jgi:hypothetical protein
MAFLIIYNNTWIPAFTGMTEWENLFKKIYGVL